MVRRIKRELQWLCILAIATFLPPAILLGGLPSPGTSPRAGASPRIPMPKLEGITAYGCRIVRTDAGAWRLYGWADHGASAEPGKGHDWRVWISERSGRNGEKKALADCQAFMGAVERAVKARAAPSAHTAWAEKHRSGCCGIGL